MNMERELAEDSENELILNTGSYCREWFERPQKGERLKILQPVLRALDHMGWEIGRQQDVDECLTKIDLHELFPKAKIVDQVWTSSCREGKDVHHSEKVDPMPQVRSSYV